MKRFSLLTLVVCGILCFTGCGTDQPAASSQSKSGSESSAEDSQTAADAVYEDTQELMGTVIMVRAYGAHGKEGVEAAFARAKELEQVFSNTIADSEVNQVNQAAKAAVGTEVPISADMAHVLETALEYGEKSGGMLDCTIGDLIDLWGIGTDHAAIPADGKIQALLRPDGWKDVSYHAESGSLTFASDAVTLNFGAVAKGYISDAMKTALEETGVTSALMSLGGNVMTLGVKPDGSSWTVAITDPFSPDSLIASLHVTDQAVVTSGNYEKYFEENGKRYHHILDPYTGAPSESDVVSTTIIADNGIDCDALSTATYLLGSDAGMQLINSLDGIEAVFVKATGELVTSDGMDAYQLQEITS